MHEIVKIVNGHRYKYARYWDKETKKRKDVYLGRVLDNGEILPPSGNISVKKIEEAMNYLTNLGGLTRKEALNFIAPYIQKRQTSRAIDKTPHMNIIKMIALVLGSIIACGFMLWGLLWAMKFFGFGS